MKKITKFLITTLCMVSATFFLFSFSSCKKNNKGESLSSDSSSVEESVVGNLTLSTEAQTLNIGEEYTLVANKENISGEIVWTSSDTSVATVVGGKVVACQAGSTTITATAGEYSAKCTVTVVAPTLSLSKSVTNLYIGQTDSVVVSVTEKEGVAVDGISYTWTVTNGAEHIEVTPLEDTSTLQIKAEALGVATVSVSVTYKGVALEKEIDVAVISDLYIGANVDSDFTLVKGGYEKQLTYAFELEGYDKSFGLEDFQVYNKDVIVENATLTWETSNPDVAKIENGSVISCGKGTANVIGVYTDAQTGETVNVIIKVSVDEMFTEKVFNVNLGNNVNVDGLKLTFRNINDENDVRTVALADGKATLTLLKDAQAEYEITSQIYGITVNFGSVTIAEETEYSLTTPDFYNTTAEGSTCESFNAANMSVTFKGQGSSKYYFVQGQEISGEYWVGLKFKRMATDGVLSTFYYFNDGGMGIYVYLVSVPGQLAVRVSTGENGWTEYQVNGEMFGYPGINDPYVFIRRHNNNGKVAYTLYQSVMLSLDNAWSYTCTTGLDYSEDRVISTLGISSEGSNYGEGVTFEKIYSAESQEKLFEAYSSNDAEEVVDGKAFYVSLGNNANVNGLTLTFRNKADANDVQTAVVTNGKAIAFDESAQGNEYDVTAEIFGATVSFGTVTIGEDKEYTLTTFDFSNTTEAGSSCELFNAENMSVAFAGQGSSKHYFVQNQTITGEYWVGMKFNGNASDGVLSTFYYFNDGGIGIYVYLISVPGQLAVRVATGENGWTEYKVNGESFGYPGINNPYVFIRRHNDNGKVAYTIYQNATPSLEGAWSYTCTTGLDYSDDRVISTFGINSEVVDYGTGISFVNMYSAESQEKLLKKYE